MQPDTREFVQRLTLWLTITGQYELRKQLPKYVEICATPETLAQAIAERKKRESS